MEKRRKEIKKMTNLSTKGLVAAGIAFSILAGALARTTAAHAQNVTQVALTAVPPRLGDDYTLSVKPGQTVQAAIEVRNPTDDTVTVETFIRDMIVGDDGETPYPVEEGEITSNKWALSKWVIMNPVQSVIAPRGSQQILVTITVPTDAAPGGHYAMILHRPVSYENNGTTTGAQITAQVGTLLYVIVDGQMSEKANVDTFAFKGFSEMGPVPYQVAIYNDSSMHIRPTGTIEITNMFGKTVGQIDLDQANIFPDSARTFEGSWNTKWGFGKYTATLHANYGTTGSSALSAATTFWIMPVRLILAVILVIVVVCVILMATRSKYTKMIEAEEEKVRKLDEKLKKARRAEK